MRSAVLGLLGGAAWLQMQAALPRDPALALLFIVALGVALLAWRSRISCAAGHVLCVTLGFAIGFLWAALRAEMALAPALARADEGRDIAIVGVIDGLPAQFDGGQRFQLSVERGAGVPPRIALSWYASQGRSIAPLPLVQPGQRWRLTVRLQRPHGNANPNGFDYELWLLEQGIRATGYVRHDAGNAMLDDLVPGIRNVIHRARAGLRERIRLALSGRRYAGVIAALAIGDQRGIAAEDWQVFSKTGVSHLVAISGLHITMIAGLAAGLASWLWRRSFFMPRWQLPLSLPAPKMAALSGLLAAMAYVALAGFGVPAQRTLCMLAVVALARWLDRMVAVSHVLALAAAAVVLLDPWAVTAPGFWLSFCAVAVIIYGSEGRPAMPGGVMPAVRTQYLVTVGLVPLTALLFSQVSMVGPLANAAAIPMVSAIVTPLALLGSIAPDPLATPLLKVAEAAFAALAYWLRWLAGQPFATWIVPAPAWWTLLPAAAGTAWLLAPRGWPARWIGWLSWAPMLLARPAAPEPGVARLTVLDVGQGMAVLVETARHRLLYDAGPQYTADANAGNRVILPYLRARGVGRLDGLIVSHSDSDHAGGALEVLRGMDVGWTLTSLPGAHPVMRMAQHPMRCHAGQAWTWEGVRFDVLHPAAQSYTDRTLKPNARSCTLKISADGGVALLPGDIEAREERRLLEQVGDGLHADVLLVPHHGSATSSTPAFLAAVQPSHALFQVGYRNRYHHPRADVVARYAALGASLWRTDEAGAIQIDLGAQVALSTYRNRHNRYWYGR